VTLKVRIQRGKVDVKLYPGEPRDFLNEPGGPVVRDLERRMLRAQIRSEQLVRVRTGTLLATIHKERSTYRRLPAVEVVAGRARMKYTMLEHDGTPPHIIRARRKKALRFTVGGKVVFRKSVRHPGTTGTHFLTKSLPLAGGGA